MGLTYLWGCRRTGQAKEEGCPLIHFGLCPRAATVTLDHPPHVGQTDPGSLIIFPAMQPLEHPKQLVCILHVETHSIVFDPNDYLAVLLQAADLDLGDVLITRVLD